MNVPDDWNCYWNRCENCGTQYHASEGGCECYLSDVAHSQRPWLEESDYDYCEGEWSKLLSVRVHVARRDHADGRVLRGQRYRVTRTRFIDDVSGNSRHHVARVVLS